MKQFSNLWRIWIVLAATLVWSGCQTASVEAPASATDETATSVVEEAAPEVVPLELTDAQKAEAESIVKGPPTVLPVFWLREGGPDDGDPLKINWAGVTPLQITRHVAGFTVVGREIRLQLVHDVKRLYVQLAEPVDTTTLANPGDRWNFTLATRRGAPERLELSVLARGKLDVRLGSGQGIRLETVKDPQLWTMSLSIPLEGVLAGTDVLFFNAVRGVQKDAGLAMALSPTGELGPEEAQARLVELRLENPISDIPAAVPPPPTDLPVP